MDPVIVLVICCILAAVVIVAETTSIIIRAKIKRSFCKRFAELFVDHAKEFEGLYESLYVSCKSKPFDPDAYIEWCDSADLCSDKSFSRAFSASFPKLDDKKKCKRKSSDLLACIKYAGIQRQGEAGESIMINSSNDKLFECINSDDAVGKTCSVIKPAWVLDGKAIEPGVIKA